MPKTLHELLTDLSATLERDHATMKASRGGSRFATADANDAVVNRLAGEPAGKAVEANGKPSPALGLAKAMAEATGTAGGFLVQSDVAADVYRSLRAQSVVLSMPGVRRVPVAKELLVNSISSGPAAQYTAENANLPVSEASFSQDVLLRPRALGTVVPVSNRLLRDARDTPDLDALLRDELAEIMALRVRPGVLTWNRFQRGAARHRQHPGGWDRTGARRERRVSVARSGSGDRRAPPHG